LYGEWAVPIFRTKCGIIKQSSIEPQELAAANCVERLDPDGVLKLPQLVKRPRPADDGRDILSPSAPKRGELTVSVPPSMALKAAVYLAVREAGISTSEFARRMRLDEEEARRILDPHHPTKLARIEGALSVLGRHIELSLA
jgi:hypothetical protein